MMSELENESEHLAPRLVLQQEQEQEQEQEALYNVGMDAFSMAGNDSNGTGRQCWHSDVLDQFSEHYGSMHGYFGFTICLIGSLADFAIVSVLVRRHMHTSTNMLLLWIAVTDFLTMAICAPTYWHFYIYKHPEVQLLCTLEFGWILYFVFYSSFCILCHVASIWLTVALAAFRLLYLTMQDSPVRSIGVAHTVTAVIYVCALLATIPNMLVNGYSSMNTTMYGNTESVYHIDESAIAATYSSVEVINFWISALVMRIVPSMLMLAFTVLLVRQMRQASMRRKRLLKSKSLSDVNRTQNRTSELRTTSMLLCVVGTFIVVELPQGILSVINYYDECFYTGVYHKLGDLIDCITLFKNIITFVLLTSMSKQFRDTFIASIRRLLLLNRITDKQPLERDHQKKQLHSNKDAGKKYTEIKLCARSEPRERNESEDERVRAPGRIDTNVVTRSGISTRIGDFTAPTSVIIVRANGSSCTADQNDACTLGLL